MTAWLREFRLALRSLARKPGFAALAIITLALGIGANTAIFSVIYGSLLRPLPYADPDRLVWLSDGHERFGGSGVDQSLPNLLDLRAGSRILASSAMYTTANSNLATAERPVRVRVLRTSSEMLSVLGVIPRRGRDLLPEDDRAGATRVAILTDETWRTRFGADPDIVGQTTTLDAAPVVIVGVTPPGFSFPDVPDLIMPIQHEGEEFERGSRYLHAIGRLAPGATIGALRAELQQIFDGLVEQYPGPNEDWFTWADPLSDYAVGRNRSALLLFAGAVGLVLLIACVNVANLLIVRAETRQRELAVRYALGAGRYGLLPHFLSEGLILALAGGVLGTFGAYWGVDVLMSLYGGAIQRADQITLDRNALAFGVVTALIVGIAVGLVPLIRTRPSLLHQSLKEGGRGSSGRSTRLASALVTAEVALAVLIVTGAGLLTNSVWRLQQIELGVADEERVLAFQFSLPEARYQEAASMRVFHDRLLQELGRMPGVQAAGLVNRLPLLGGYNTTNFAAVEDPDRVAHFVSIRAVTPGYFGAAGVPLLRGRWLNPSEFAEEELRSVLINETLARQLFGDDDPVGRRVGPNWREGGLDVVGVVGDIAGGSPTRPAPPAFYFPLAANTPRDMSALVRTSDDPSALLPGIRRVVERLDPEVPIFGMRTLEEIARARLGSRRMAMSLFGIFAALALLLGAIGIYGVMAYSVTRRSGELGVRLALGASRGSVMRLVMRQGVHLTLPGILVGLFLALASGRVIRSLLYEVSALDPLTYGAVTGVLAAVSMAATCIPAYRATRVDPVSSIKSE